MIEMHYKLAHYDTGRFILFTSAKLILDQWQYFEKYAPVQILSNTEW